MPQVVANPGGTDLEAEMREGMHVREAGRGTSLGDYWPLIALVLGTALAAVAIPTGFGRLTMETFMHAYMGVFLFVFALLKLFDLEGFKDGFAMYDLIGSRHAAYGYAYPFVELGLALAFLAFVAPPVTYLLTILVFGAGAVGVLVAVRRGLDMDCPCMGNVLSVPLSTVTLTEDLAMVAMAAYLLLG